MSYETENNEKEWFPIEYEGVLYEKEDCNDFFLELYSGPDSIDAEGGYYMADGVSVYPDGTMRDVKTEN